MKPRPVPELAPPAPDDQTPRGTRIITGQLHRVRHGHGWTFRAEPPAPPLEPVRRPARVARTLALAHRINAEIEGGEHVDRADAARKLGITRARVTQLLDLILLAPDLQEYVLGLEAVDGVEPLSERMLREVLRAETWAEQRAVWWQGRARCRQGAQSGELRSSKT